MNTTLTNHVVDESQAALFAAWLATRGGIAVWSSQDLSNPGASWSTPALSEAGLKTEAPHWSCRFSEPRVITSMDEVEVVTYEEVKRFHIALRVAGFAIKVSDGGSRRIRKEVMKAGDGATYKFDADEVAILTPAKTVTLREWIQTR